MKYMYWMSYKVGKGLWKQHPSAETKKDLQVIISGLLSEEGGATEIKIQKVRLMKGK